MAASLPLGVLLLIGVATGASSKYSTLGDIISDLSDACLDAASRSVAHQEVRRGQQQTSREIRSGQQRMQEQLTALQEQLAERVQEQLSALQEQLTALQPAPEDCPAGWSRHGHNCYFIPPLVASWLQAHRACVVLDRRARLASVHPASSQHIEALVAASGTERVWIGLARLSAENWAWSDGTPLDYTNWSLGDPNNHPKPSNCAQVNGPRYTGPRGWNDFNCYSPSNFLCQIGLA